MFDLPKHYPMPVNSEGEGPEDPDKAVRTICGWCLPAEDWPCEAKRSEPL